MRILELVSVNGSISMGIGIQPNSWEDANGSTSIEEASHSRTEKAPGFPPP